MRAALILTLASALLASCQTQRPYEANNLGGVFYQAAETLELRSARIISREKPVLVATMVDVGDLHRSDAFGKLASQMIASRLAQHGYIIKDMTYTGALEIDEATGERVLSREARELMTTFDAQAVIAGTYAVAGDEIWLNVRLLSATDGRIVSAVDLSVPINNNTRPLLLAAHR